MLLYILSRYINMRVGREGVEGREEVVPKNERRACVVIRAQCGSARDCCVVEEEEEGVVEIDKIDRRRRRCASSSAHLARLTRYRRIETCVEMVFCISVMDLLNSMRAFWKLEHTGVFRSAD